MRLKDKVKVDIDPKYYKRLAQVESSGNTNATPPINPATGKPYSTAAGQFQFLKGTWNSMVKKMGLDYTEDDRFDPVKSQKVVERFTKDNERYLEKKLGRKPNEAELYLAHFRGANGAWSTLKDLNRPIKEFVPQETINANPAVFKNMSTAADLYNWSAKKFGLPPVKTEEENAIYSTDENGNTVVVNPKFATQAEITNSDNYKEKFEANLELPLTNLDSSEENVTFTEEGAVVEPVELSDPWMESLQQKMDSRKQFIDFVEQGGIDYQAPDYIRPNAAKDLQKGYMQDGGTMEVRNKAYRDSLDLYEEYKYFSDDYLKYPTQYNTDKRLIEELGYNEDEIKPIALSYSDAAPAYKKPTPPRRPDVHSVGNIPTRGLVPFQEEMTTPQGVWEPVIDKWKVTENVVQNFGGSRKQHEVFSEKELNDIQKKFNADKSFNAGSRNYLEVEPITGKGRKYEKFQNGGLKPAITQQDVEESKTFVQDYHNSPKFAERYLNDFGVDKQEQLSSRVRDINNNFNTSTTAVHKGVGDSLGSHYDDVSNSINIFEKEGLRGFSNSSLPAHEYSHMSERFDFLNSKKMMDEVYKRKLKNDSRSNDFSEIRADVNGLRYLMNKEGINDARTQDFTEKDFKKVEKVLGKDTSFKRLNENFKDEDLIWLMNNLADTQDTEDKFYAQDGGTLKNDFISLPEDADEEVQNQLRISYARAKKLDGEQLGGFEDQKDSDEEWRNSRDKYFSDSFSQWLTGKTGQTKNSKLTQIDPAYQQFWKDTKSEWYKNNPRPINDVVKNYQESREFNNANEVVNENDTVSNQYEDGGRVLTSERGLYDYPDAEMILVPTKDGRITMKDIKFPVKGIADTGEEILMQPGKEYHFKGAKTVLEIPQRNG